MSALLDVWKNVPLAHNTIHLFAAPRLRRHVSTLFEMPNMLATQSQDNLIFVDLPLQPGVLTPVLVQVMARDQQSCTLILDDDDAPLTKLLIGPAIPEIYNPRAAGSLKGLLASNLEAANAVHAAGGIAASGLTTARAVIMMRDDLALSAQDALTKARSIGSACAQMVDRQAEVTARLRSA